MPFVLTWYPSQRAPAATAIDAEHALRETDEYWQRLGRPLRVHGRVARGRPPLAHRAEGADLRADRRHRRGARRRRCRRRSAACATGTTATAGCATPRSRCLRSSTPATSRRRARGGDWLLRAAAGDPAALQIMYGVGGERRLPELDLDWLPGYEGSQPSAHRQRGRRPVPARRVRRGARRAPPGARPRAARLEGGLGAAAPSCSSYLEDAWKEPDEGIWEVRGPRRHFTHSKVMAWVAFDRGVQAVERFGLDGPVERWRAIRAEIHAEVCEQRLRRRAAIRSRSPTAEARSTRAC